MMTLTSTQLGQLAAQFFLAGAGTLSFAVLFACPKRTLPYCALVGAVGWFVYELASYMGPMRRQPPSSRSSRCRWRRVSAPCCSRRR